MAPRVQLVSLDDVERTLDALVRQPPLPPRGRAFLLGQALAHCGQSVRCSLTGYPKMRSALFRATLGRIALRKFLGQGYLSHDRAAQLAGTECIPTQVTLDDGADQLRSAIAAFRAHEGPLAPHLAFGVMPRELYARVHAMHVADHLSAFAPSTRDVRPSA